MPNFVYSSLYLVNILGIDSPCAVKLNKYLIHVAPNAFHQTVTLGYVGGVGYKVNSRTNAVTDIRRLYTRFSPTLIKVAWADNEAQALINSLRTACRNAKLFIRVTDCYKAPIKDRITTLDTLMSQGRFYVMRNCTHVTVILKH